MVIGSPKKGGHTERLIRELELEKDVIFKSNITKEEIRDLYSTSSVAIVSSLYEGFGLPILEAMSCGTPVITSNYSALPEVGGNSVLYVDPKNEDNIASKQKLKN